MKSLAERKADRRRRLAESRKEADAMGIDRDAPAAGSTATAPFDVAEFLSSDVKTVTSMLPDLPDADFAAVVEHGDKRAGVTSAIEAEQKRRDSRGNTDWTPNL